MRDLGKSFPSPPSSSAFPRPYKLPLPSSGLHLLPLPTDTYHIHPSPYLVNATHPTLSPPPACDRIGNHAGLLPLSIQSGQSQLLHSAKIRLLLSSPSTPWSSLPSPRPPGTLTASVATSAFSPHSSRVSFLITTSRGLGGGGEGHLRCSVPCTTSQAGSSTRPQPPPHSLLQDHSLFFLQLTLTCPLRSTLLLQEALLASSDWARNPVHQCHGFWNFSSEVLIPIIIKHVYDGMNRSDTVPGMSAL